MKVKLQTGDTIRDTVCPLMVAPLSGAVMVGKHICAGVGVGDGVAVGLGVVVGDGDGVGVGVGVGVGTPAGKCATSDVPGVGVGVGAVPPGTSISADATNATITAASQKRPELRQALIT